MYRFFILFAFVFVATHQAKAADLDKNDLQGVLTHVYQNDPSLMAERAALQAAHELYPQALAGRRPTLSAEGSIYTTDVESSNFSQGSGATTKDISLNAEQPLYTSGRTDAEVDKANNLIKAAYASYLKAEQDLFYDATTAYMAVVRDRELVQLSQENEEILNAEYTAVNQRFNGGDLTRTDVEQTQARMARAKANRLAAWRDLETSYAEFEKTVGYLPLGVFYYPVATFAFPKTLDEMFRIADMHSQIISEARFRLAAAQDEIDSNLSDLWPVISAFASYNKQYDPQPGIVAESETQAIGIRATLTLYEGGAQQSRIRESKSLARERIYRLADTQQDIHSNILRHWKSMKMADAEMESRKEELEAARRARTGVKEESHMGERTVLDVLDADQDILQAQKSYVQARYISIVARFALAHALGIFSPESIGLGQIAYDPGDHYRAAGDKWFSLDDQE